MSAVASAPMLRAAVLQHDTPDGSRHLDLLIETRAGADADERALAAFRVESPRDAAVLLALARDGVRARFDAERLGDHRRFYLEHEGPITGDRGAVERLAAGGVLCLDFEDARIGATIDFGGGPVRIRGDRVGAGPIWRFDCRAIE